MQSASQASSKRGWHCTRTLLQSFPGTQWPAAAPRPRSPTPGPSGPPRQTQRRAKAAAQPGGAVGKHRRVRSARTAALTFRSKDRAAHNLPTTSRAARWRHGCMASRTSTGLQVTTHAWLCTRQDIRRICTCQKATRACQPKRLAWGPVRLPGAHHIALVARGRRRPRRGNARVRARRPALAGGPLARRSVRVKHQQRLYHKQLGEQAAGRCRARQQLHVCRGHPLTAHRHGQGHQDGRRPDELRRHHGSA